MNLEVCNKDRVIEMTQCKYGNGCTRANCKYTHTETDTENPSHQPPSKKEGKWCSWGPFCCNFKCDKLHPVDPNGKKNCMFGSSCSKDGCRYRHIQPKQTE